MVEENTVFRDPDSREQWVVSNSPLSINKL